MPKLVGPSPRLIVHSLTNHSNGVWFEVVVETGLMPGDTLYNNTLFAYFVPPGEHPDSNPSFLFREGPVAMNNKFPLDGISWYTDADGKQAADLFIRAEDPSAGQEKASPWVSVSLRAER